MSTIASILRWRHSTREAPILMPVLPSLQGFRSSFVLLVPHSGCFNAENNYRPRVEDTDAPSRWGVHESYSRCSRSITDYARGRYRQRSACTFASSVGLFSGYHCRHYCALHAPERKARYAARKPERREVNRQAHLPRSTGLVRVVSMWSLESR